ncbi:MAG: peptidylprolyl isomerase [Microcoleus sp. SIO2G3]|nr:peptidylprolyl isomerase [Microcoleus sp. SIO2G3]
MITTLTTLTAQDYFDKIKSLRSPEEIQAEANRLRYEKRLEKAADTLAWLASEMISVEDWEAGICDRILAKKLAESLFSKEVEKVFAQNRLDFDQILLYQIVFSDAKLAQELFYQIEDREISFYEAAHLYDVDERRRQQCGYEGKLFRWNLKPDLATVVFSAKPGEVLGPLKTEQGHHLLMVEAFIPAQLTPQRYQDILDRMFKEWLISELNYMLHSKTA